MSFNHLSAREVRELIENDQQTFWAQLREEMPAPSDEEIERVHASVRDACARKELLDSLGSMLREAEFSTDDLRFLFVITTMAIAVKPAAFFERLRTSGASNPLSDAP
jgi:hypothetical protein